MQSQSTINSILIANRGEIACRIINSCKKLGIKSIAIYSEADRGALHTQLADIAVCIGGPTAAESYLLGKEIVAVAKRLGANAIHPGYGFLAEDANFSKLVNDNKLIFIGPSAKTLKILGDKASAKALAIKANVPVVPGSNSATKKEAKNLGTPFLIKATAGGGGRGMRHIDSLDNFTEELKRAKREAKSFFGDDTVILEKLVTPARHIEVQLLGDKHGEVIHLFERDCSLQRRHQKIIEESPADNLSRASRKALLEAAVTLGKAANLTGAATVEFLVDEQEQFYFLEVNPRLQVEHPVTELQTGLDLVELQIKIAEGASLAKIIPEVKEAGASIEARVCAEIPRKDFMPSTGQITFYQEPKNVRVDTGIKAGSRVTPYYDSLLLKVITHGKNHSEARNILKQSLQELIIVGVETNISFLLSLIDFMKHDSFYHTGSVERNIGKFVHNEISLDHFEQALHVALARTPLHSPQSSFQRLQNFRSTGISTTKPATSFIIKAGNKVKEIKVDEIKKSATHAAISPLDIKKPWPAYVAINGTVFTVLPKVNVEEAEESSENNIMAPLPGSILKVHIKKGQKVTKGTALLVIESMKMEHTLYAPRDAKIDTVQAKAGAQVPSGKVLITLT